ncbi:MAG: cyclopropane-fatty-acyl-phospholipid synthase [Gaiellales bacterium]|nr:cyclopropane-fatty-acyl-phospholipid synthase [Gaiellales bacterium]
MTVERPDRMAALALRAVDAILRRIRSGRLEVVLPDGSRRSYGPDGQHPVRLEVLDWAFLRRLARSPRLALGEGFQAHEWQTPDLVRLLELFADNYAPIAGEGALGALARVRGVIPRPSLPRGLHASRQDVQAHYDLSNAFFELWLDPSMTYSCGIFETPEQSLEDAQQHKYRLLCDRLALGPEHHLLEIGTGWGGMAIHAARERGCRVTTTTISRAQHELASRRIAEAGVADRVRVLERDYRTLTGRYDRIVSIEMLEAIGHDQLPTYFGALDRLLAPSGVIAIQTITIPEQRYRSYRRSEDWLRRHVFPGGLLPSVGDITRVCAPSSRLGMYGLDEIGPHYLTTLAHWRTRFLEQLSEVRALGFDERFCRTWEFYLAYCEAAFASRAIRDVQLVLARPFEREAPTVGYGRSHPGWEASSRELSSVADGDRGDGRAPVGSTASPASSGGASR